MPMIVCPQCQRHIKYGESQCPFCAADVSAIAPPTTGPVRPRTSRAALVLAAVTAAAAAGGAAAGCSDDDDDDDEEMGQPQPVYGAPVEDGGVTDGGEDAAVDGGGLVVPAYGIAPEEDAGTGVPVYGIAPDAE